MTQDKMVTPVKKTKKTKKAKTPKNTRILFILDRSGSMRAIMDDTIGGFNSYVAGQLDCPGEATLSLIQFDHECLIVHDNVPVADVPEMTRETFVPRGMTALYDAVGMTISQFKEAPKDTKTIVMILTDGQENSSKEYTFSSVKKLIQEVEDDLGWEVMFLGANMDAGQVAASMGIKGMNAATFDFSANGAADALSSVTLATRSMRGASFSYADGTSSADGLDMSKLYNDVKAKSIPTK